VRTDGAVWSQCVQVILSQFPQYSTSEYVCPPPHIMYNWQIFMGPYKRCISVGGMGIILHISLISKIYWCLLPVFFLAKEAPARWTERWLGPKVVSAKWQRKLREYPSNTHHENVVIISAFNAYVTIYRWWATRMWGMHDGGDWILHRKCGNRGPLLLRHAAPR